MKLILTIIFWPWMLGLADALSWRYVGMQATAINWASNLAIFLVLWPAGAIGAFAVLAIWRERDHPVRWPGEQG